MAGEESAGFPFFFFPSFYSFPTSSILPFSFFSPLHTLPIHSFHSASHSSSALHPSSPYYQIIHQTKQTNKTVKGSKIRGNNDFFYSYRLNCVSEEGEGGEQEGGNRVRIKVNDEPAPTLCFSNLLERFVVHKSCFWGGFFFFFCEGEG